MKEQAIVKAKEEEIRQREEYLAIVKEEEIAKIKE